jgi:hypothetical protein
MRARILRFKAVFSGGRHFAGITLWLRQSERPPSLAVPRNVPRERPHGKKSRAYESSRLFIDVVLRDQRCGGYSP